MNYLHYFELGGVVVPIEANTEFEQTYRTLEARTWPPVRTVNGSAIMQSAWTGKLRTEISAAGWIQPGLSGLDYDSSHVLKCGQPFGIHTASTTVTLPAARRSDAGYEPYAVAIVDGAAVETTVSVTGDTATITAVTGASGYVCYYYPQITVYAQPPVQSGSLTAGTVRWTLEAEEV